MILDWYNGNPFPGCGDVYVNGRKNDEGFTYIRTIFGIGFGRYDKSDGRGGFLIEGDKIAQGWVVGFIRFVPAKTNGIIQK